LDGSRNTLDEVHPSTLTSANNLATLLQDQGKFAEAEPLFRQALEGRRRVLGDTHPETLANVYNLASFLQA